MATKERRGFGSIERLPSGKWRAYYADPVGRTVPIANDKVKPLRHTAPWTFITKGDAEAWLTDERRLISSGTWTSPEDRRRARELEEASRLPLFSTYAERWIDQRKVKGGPLADRTKDAYRDYLKRFLVPEFGHLHLDEITPGMVNDWYDQLLPKRKGRGDTGEAMRGKVYSYARAVMNTAVSAHGPMPGAVNPFAVRGGGSSASTKRRDDQVATAAEVKTMIENMREDRRLMLLLALWCGLRYSEIAALRRSDFDMKNNTVKISRAVSRSRENGVRDKGPKSDAGNRTMRLPAMIVPDVKKHLRAIVTGKDGLLFPGTEGGYLAPASFYGKVGGNGWYGARKAAGRDDLHFHDLRATGATLLAHAGATDAEVQAWLGDSTPQAAQRHVRASRSRMDMLAERLSATAESGDW